MLALLFTCPIRLNNFAGLRLGRQIRKVGTGWWLEHDEEETKSGRVSLREIPSELAAYLERWNDHWRLVFHPAGDAFWPSIKGDGLAYTWVGTLISRITERELDVDINPHLARDCAVYTIATTAGNEMGVASAILDHLDPRTTNRDYNKGKRVQAVQRYHALLDRLEDED